jgi:hypothetical protein
MWPHRLVVSRGTTTLRRVVSSVDADGCLTLLLLRLGV